MEVLAAIMLMAVVVVVLLSDRVQGPRAVSSVRRRLHVPHIKIGEASRQTSRNILYQNVSLPAFLHTTHTAKMANDNGPTKVSDPLAGMAHSEVHYFNRYSLPQRAEPARESRAADLM